MFSLITHGIFNITAHNICDHCISATGTHVINQENLEVDPGACKVFGNLFTNLSGLGVGA